MKKNEEEKKKQQPRNIMCYVSPMSNNTQEKQRGSLDLPHPQLLLCCVAPLSKTRTRAQGADTPQALRQMAAYTGCATACC